MFVADCYEECNGIDRTTYVGGGIVSDDVIGRTSLELSCADNLVTLESLFANIQRLIAMAAEKTRQREQQNVYEKGFGVISLKGFPVFLDSYTFLCLTPSLAEHCWV